MAYLRVYGGIFEDESLSFKCKPLIFKYQEFNLVRRCLPHGPRYLILKHQALILQCQVSADIPQQLIFKPQRLSFQDERLSFQDYGLIYKDKRVIFKD